MVPIHARGAWEEEEVTQRRRRDEELNAVLYEQGIVRSRDFDDNMAACRHEATVQDAIFADITSSDDD
ncbi:hypothetical protein D1007_04351 [Hordeum vulgare]|nr:hypothetical protein D1007_04351 [Hordeum vulgare]